MLGENTFFYTYSTIAQVIAAIVAIIAIFVFHKHNDYKSKMQREMSNIVNALEKILMIPKNRPDLYSWKTQATKAERHGVLTEMNDIFKDHLSRNLGEDINIFCENGIKNYNSNTKLIDAFRKVVIFGIFLICLSLILLSVTSSNIICNFMITSYTFLYGSVMTTAGYLIALGIFLNSITNESK